MTSDAFDTAALRAAVLEAWRASPARLREDANTEEDHARGYYRDRVLVELAQNASDAATRAGVPGRLLLRLATTQDGAVLVAANTGAPLDAAGVASLASMRASAKRDAQAGRGPAAPGVVGRFGVGFAAVRSVADEVSVLSTTGGVRFSLADTRELLAEATADLPDLADEVRRRDGSLPALRLPLPAEGTPPTGYDTAVVLELRDEVATDEVRALLAAVGDPLLLALPGLVEIVIEDDGADQPVRRIAQVGERWHVASAQGELDLALLADRPVEERDARAWRVTWAVPVAGSGAAWERVVHAPTPTDEPCTAPALLVATFPLDPARRHVARGPLTDAVLDHAADVYARLATTLADAGDDPLALVPTGLPGGALDGALRERLVERLARTPLLAPAARPLPGAAGDEDADVGGLLEPGRSVALAGPAGRDPGAVAALAEHASGLVRLAPGSEVAARTLGVELRDLSDLVEELPAAGGADPGRWRDLYAALAPVASEPDVREQLGALPVPLADGRVVRGARGLVLRDTSVGDAAQDVAFEVLSRWGLRVVHPDAAHPLLESLGATPSDAAGLLAHPAVRQAVLDQADDDDLQLADEVTGAVLTLVRAALDEREADPAQALPAEVLAWLGLLTLPAADGEPTPAHGLLLPGSDAERLLDARVLAAVEVATLERWGADVLVAAGVRDDLVTVRVGDVVVDVDALDLDADGADQLVAQSLDGWEDYVAELARVLGTGSYVAEVDAVADLDAVADDAWPQVLTRIASVPRLRSALLDPVRAEGVARTAPSYTAWWLRTRSGLGLGRPFAPADADEAARELLPAAPDVVAGLDSEVQRALGGVSDLHGLDAAAWGVLLDGLGDAGTPVDLALAVGLWRTWAWIARHAPQDGPGEGVDLLPALVSAEQAQVAETDDMAVADAPMWLQRTDLAALIPVPALLPGQQEGSDRSTAEALAALLDLPLASDLAPGRVEAAAEDDADDAPDDAGAEDDGGPVRVPTPPEVLALLPGAPATWIEHDVLRVDGVPVDWWVEGAGESAVVHATQLAGLARALGQAAGRFWARHVVETVLTDPDRLPELRVEAALDPDLQARG
ncbi:sacsin N-terminal ATP-binding-like domain-containing protein [Cellulomonas timonensis]|uniref:sacsin N-terminal ATP-binding-like domain-containing protein n=1 Tax=Cellulomonas timonensis TaxID=1689271 RepID=UPI00082DF008|nr:ATP-binding protein [Cellulomonas timonensis]